MSSPMDKDVAALKDSGQFDADWYLATHPDVAITGLDPAVHYLRYGHKMNRDPGPMFSTRFVRTAYGIKVEQEPLALLEWMRRKAGDEPVAPNSKRILMAANRVAQAGDHNRAIALAEEHLPADLAYTAHVLHANAALARGDEAGWQMHLNAYLAQFGAAPIRLEGSGTVFDRLTGTPLPPVTGGPLVSVIMPAWNAEKTVRKAAQSILVQTWRNLELLIVDDASTDGTWAVLQEISARDSRVKLLRNRVNVGPYVSKNIALTQARGDWITGHDADDWALTHRIESHMSMVLKSGKPKASLTYMIRIKTDGKLESIGSQTDFSPDGVLRLSSISTLFERGFMQDHLGHWDSVRFAADSEIISRARVLIGSEFQNFREIGMICLCLPSSLTNHSETGISAGTSGELSPKRQAFKAAWKIWHQSLVGQSSGILEFPLTGDRPYAAPEEMIVALADVKINLPKGTNWRLA
jgi:hypothetical protein